ncbi:CDP-diacylglycerol diphosphatase [Mycobacterium sp. 1274761.0]|uniref:CDP-diacylglycerol pyrophosphatase n=1 Tax=Mycobacterium sp. 1274761.0 TaxID=1834077 RepID=UPI0007FEDB89|nr:CDP-diacylglycerol diphosphatase [Mycobacterium sp. 1274761.0]OBK72384.1 hypothetical protein A5651_16110 [Mycobacterium sp. 1274761.0]
MAALLAVLALAGSPKAAADPNALWSIVDGQCIQHQLANDDPKPCELVDVDGGYAVLKDIVGATQFLLIPTARVGGIESPQILAPGAPNYFADAWRARSFVEQRARRAIPRDWMSLAINSADARSQDQLHIHIDCVRADVHQALAAHVGDIGPTWAPLPVALAGQRYQAMTLQDRDLDSHNVFRLLADSLPAADDMGAQTLVVVGSPAPDGFIVLGGRAEPDVPGSGHGEDLQDHVACPPAAEVPAR